MTKGMTKRISSHVDVDDPIAVEVDKPMEGEACRRLMICLFGDKAGRIGDLLLQESPDALLHDETTSREVREEFETLIERLGRDEARSSLAHELCDELIAHELRETPPPQGVASARRRSSLVWTLAAAAAAAVVACCVFVHPDVRHLVADVFHAMVDRGSPVGKGTENDDGVTFATRFGPLPSMLLLQVASVPDAAYPGCANSATLANNLGARDPAIRPDDPHGTGATGPWPGRLRLPAFAGMFSIVYLPASFDGSPDSHGASARAASMATLFAGAHLVGHNAGIGSKIDNTTYNMLPNSPDLDRYYRMQPRPPGMTDAHRRQVATGGVRARAAPPSNGEAASGAITTRLAGSAEPVPAALMETASHGSLHVIPVSLTRY
jgi:hypothetical protein